MYTLRRRLIVTSAAIMSVAIPGLAMAVDTPPDAQQSTASAQENQSSRQDDQSQQAQQTANQTERQNDQSRTDESARNQNESQNANQSVKGEVQSYREVNIDGTQHFRARVKTPSGSIETVDFGPSDQSKNLIDNIEQGDHIAVQGHPDKVDGKPVFCAEQARVDGETYQIASRESQNESSNSRTAEANDQPNQQQPNAVVLLNERFVFVDEGDLNRHLILAKEALRMGDRRGAEGELLVAAERLGLYTNGQGGKQATEDLNNARQDLRQLAQQIGKHDSNVSPREIDQAASRAQSAMAVLFADRVQSEKGNERAIEAGYDLESAAVHAREALLWTDQNVPDETAHSIRQAMQTADDLISGNDQSSQKADQIEQTLARDITQIDKQDDESQAQPAAEQTPGKQNSKESDNSQHESNSHSS